MKAVAEAVSPEEALARARVEIRTLTNQLRQARVDLHRLGIADQNRALMYATAAGGLGLIVGVVLGIRFARAV
jgi:hypothetical protein